MPSARDPKIRPSRQWRVAVAAMLILLLGGLAFRELSVPLARSSMPRETSSANQDGGSNPLRLDLPNFSFDAGPPPSDLPSSARAMAAPAEPEPALAPPEPIPVPSAAPDVPLAAPGLRLAVADFPKIFNAYYKTKIARAELLAWKGDQAEREQRIRAAHEQLTAEIKQVILQYSLAHDLDLVLDSGSPLASSGVPFVLYHRPGLDISDGVIALANAGHEDD
jgi:hypothetical protein